MRAPPAYPISYALNFADYEGSLRLPDAAEAHHQRMTQRAAYQRVLEACRGTKWFDERRGQETW